MRHKKYSWLLAVLLMLSMVLAGCGKAADISGQVTPAATEEVPTEEAPVADNPLSLGRLEGGIYTNAYAGFGCELDASWTFYSAEELQDLPDAVKETLSGSDLGDTLASYEQITDMMAECPDEMITMNVLYQKLSGQERLAYALLSEEDCIDMVLEETDSLTEAYAQASINVISIEKIQVTFLGEPHFALKTTATIEGLDYYILQIYDYHLGAYSVITTFSSFIEDKTESMLDLFYKI